MVFRNSELLGSPECSVTWSYDCYLVVRHAQLLVGHAWILKFIEGNQCKPMSTNAKQNKPESNNVQQNSLL